MKYIINNLLKIKVKFYLLQPTGNLHLQLCKITLSLLKFKNALAIFCPFELKFAVCEYINGIKENGIGQECSHFMKKGA